MCTEEVERGRTAEGTPGIGVVTILLLRMDMALAVSWSSGPSKA